MAAMNGNKAENPDLHQENYSEEINPEEEQYLQQLSYVMENGEKVIDRTGVGTLSIFGQYATYSLRNGVIPLLTTKRVYWKGVVEELLWFIRGETNSKTLSAKNVKIWDANGSRQFLDKLGFTDRPEGDLGPIYGFQWRHWGAQYCGVDGDYKGKGIDQLNEVIRLIKEQPHSRRIILSSWNVQDLDQMALPPCHTLAQFAVRGGELHCQLYQRSGDMGLGVPFNLASYGLLTHMIAHVCGLKAGTLHHVLGDAHIYLNHRDALKEQMKRKPRRFPTIRFEGNLKTIDDFTYESIILEGYNPHPTIKMQMAL
uniref:Thymidylate synthase n=1 Tax=Syphacia muris TaxID=451379 RepID=A0A0N5AKV1_9BILA